MNKNDDLGKDHCNETPSPLKKNPKTPKNQRLTKEEFDKEILEIAAIEKGEKKITSARLASLESLYQKKKSAILVFKKPKHDDETPNVIELNKKKSP